ncbi:MAG: hypothetical protein LUF27_08150 [Lachnospiraceae bacterium]|nr:hypothetical protein [Lachnospiraceae bacterium]
MDYTEKALRLNRINPADYEMSNFATLTGTFLLTWLISLPVEEAQDALTHLVQSQPAPDQETGIIPRAGMSVRPDYFADAYGKAVESSVSFLRGISIDIISGTQEELGEVREMAQFMAGEESRLRAVMCVPELYDFLYDCYLAVNE